MKVTQFSYPIALMIALYVGYFVATLFLSFLPYPSLWVALIIAVVAMLMYQQTIEVTSQYVQFKMGIGLIRGRYDLRKIESCRAEKYTPLGWGIRFKPGVILFNVSGNRAVALKFFTKRYEIWLGTNHPDVVADYINQKLAEARV